jgi:lipopolysaccharide/colanic/teichoic acid biosynthesis glycosyltransferase
MFGEQPGGIELDLAKRVGVIEDQSTSDAHPDSLGSRVLTRRMAIGDEGFVDAVRRAGDRASVQVSREGEAQAGDYDQVILQEGSFRLLQDVPLALRQDADRWFVVSTEELRLSSSALQSPIPLAGRVLQRCLDLLIAPLALILLTPVLVAAMIAIIIDSPGTPVFKQTRSGVNGRRFTLYKLRTMLTNNSDEEHRRYYASLIRGEAGASAGMHKMVGDPRVTRLGHFLRHYSIDEVPQLWNVIRGDMRLVGPRPPLPSEVELYDARAFQRLRVKPGLTGLWQVSGRCTLSFSEMVELDIAYWRSWTPLTDLGILLKTPWAVLTGRGAV